MPSDEQNPQSGASDFNHLQQEQPAGVVHVNHAQENRLIVDVHTHIQSNNAAPHPTMANLVPFVGTVLHVKRSILENIGISVGHIADPPKYLVAMAKTAVGHKPKPNPEGELIHRSGLGKGPDMGSMPTDQIATAMVGRIDDMRSVFRSKPPYDKASGLEWINVIHPMDMEYCHLFGYFGLKVYNAVWKSDADTKHASLDPYTTDGKSSDAEPSMYWYPVHGKWQKKGEEFIPVDDKDASIESSEKNKDQYGEAKKRMEAEGLKGAIYDDAGNTESVRVRCLACVTPQEETKRYERWMRQVERTERAVCDANLKLLPMFHYDPRRWQSKGNGTPLSLVQGDNLYLGFKMYTAQGYRPWDINRLPVLKSFYAACESGQIPILNHCTPEGAKTYDLEAYLRFKHPHDKEEDRAAQELYAKGGAKCIKRDIRWQDGRTTHHEFDDPEAYFQEHFVSPRAWRKVLEVHPKLRLCLAHFGGIAKETKKWGWHADIISLIEDFDNVYVDISSAFCGKEFRNLFKKELVPKHPKIHDKILFGSDWPMIYTWSLWEGKEYDQFCETAKECIESMENGKELWLKFTQENPYKFYRLGDRIEGIRRGIEKKLAVERTSQGSKMQQKDSPTQRKNQNKNNLDEAKKRAEYIKQLASK